MYISKKLKNIIGANAYGVKRKCNRCGKEYKTSSTLEEICWECGKELNKKRFDKVNNSLYRNN